MYVVTDGSHEETGALIKIDPVTLNRTVLLNNYYQQPFMGFNDLEIDPDGNFWLTDSKSGYVSPNALKSLITSWTDKIAGKGFD